MTLMKRMMVIVLSLSFLFVHSSFAADPQMSAKDLKGISPKRHKYLFTTIGGAAVGAGVGILLGSGNDITKGILVGGGAASLVYLHTNRRDNIGGWRNWAYVGSGTAFGTGLGWTVCGCSTGAWSGLFIGGGASALWVASHPQPTTRTASTPNGP